LGFAAAPDAGMVVKRSTAAISSAAERFQKTGFMASCLSGIHTYL
jgi:hypothetical protein